MPHPFLTRLRAIVKTLDDEALAGLANKGLLRRAQKDLETAQPKLGEVTDALVTVELADAKVTLPELPAKSKCNCPATCICRHVLAALLYLRDDPQLAAQDVPHQQQLDLGETPAEEPATAQLSPAEALAAITDEELQKWAGKALFKKAQKALAASPQVEITTGATLVVRFVHRNITCRWIPSGGLLGLVCSCQAEAVCEHVVAAVLAFQASLGQREIVAEQTLLEEATGAPRTREEVLASVGRVLHEAVALGLTRLSDATANRLTTLAVSAHGVDLPRLERTLAGLATLVRLGLKRDAQFDSANLLYQMARCEALRLALARKATPQLVGQHRSQYFEVGQITLTGVGAQHWHSAGGYRGVTVYFWDDSTKNWASWSETRPANQAFDPVARFGSDGPWDGCPSPAAASRSVLRVTAAWRNGAGRLSGRSSTRALVMRPTKFDELPPRVTKWSELKPRVEKIFSGGLGDRPENGELVLLQPQAFGPAHYDTLRQELIRPVADADGNRLPLWLPFSPELTGAVELLDHHDARETHGVFGALRLVAGQIVVQPISLFVGDQIVHLNLPLDKQKGKSPPASSSKTAAEPGDEVLAEEETPEQEASTSAATPLGRILVTSLAELEAQAESGIAVRRALDLLTNAHTRFGALGLSTCAHPLGRYLEQLGIASRASGSDNRLTAAAALLAAYYVLRLASNQEALAGAM